MIKNYAIGECETIHYFMPGKLLDDLSLKKLHNSLIKVNEQSGANVINKMLGKHLSLEEIRNYLENTIIAISLCSKEVYGFLISPILKCGNKSILHAGLIIIEKNPGADLISLLALGNFIMGYEKLGALYTTNISSTPSIIESFSELIPGSWPGPDEKLKNPPKGFKDVVKILKEDYMDKYFLDSEKLSVNYKRFTLTSNSKEMGFTTDFYKISRADNFKYNLFCHSWIDYEKEEDIIQVGEITFLKYIRMHYLIFSLQRHLKKIASKSEMNTPSNQVNLSVGNKVA
ncbi:MAG: hypothetical protein PHY93_21690 [Bacteriovorax sp.]|nr:hypothetical protein [Bacteriovorax sp.]